MKELKSSAYVNVKGKIAEEVVQAVKEACDGVGVLGSMIPRPESLRHGVDMLRLMDFAVGTSST